MNFNSEVEDKLQFVYLLCKIFEYRKITYSEAIAKYSWLENIFLNLDDWDYLIICLSELLELEYYHDYRNEENYMISFDNVSEYDLSPLEAFSFESKKHVLFKKLQTKIYSLIFSEKISKEIANKLQDTLNSYHEKYNDYVDCYCVFHGTSDYYEGFEFVFDDFSIYDVPQLLENIVSYLKGVDALIPMYKSVLRHFKVG